MNLLDLQAVGDRSGSPFFFLFFFFFCTLCRPARRAPPRGPKTERRICFHAELEFQECKYNTAARSLMEWSPPVSSPLTCEKLKVNPAGEHTSVSLPPPAAPISNSGNSMYLPPDPCEEKTEILRNLSTGQARMVL